MMCAAMSRARYRFKGLVIETCFPKKLCVPRHRVRRPGYSVKLKRSRARRRDVDGFRISKFRLAGEELLRKRAPSSLSFKLLLARGLVTEPLDEMLAEQPDDVRLQIQSVLHSGLHLRRPGHGPQSLRISFGETTATPKSESVFAGSGRGAP
jgi:hypothetical protein